MAQRTKEEQAEYMRWYRDDKRKKEGGNPVRHSEAWSRKREGRKPKDEVIADGFNTEKLGGLSKADQRKVDAVAGDETDDTKSANQMLQDMRWVYREVQGRRKLLKLIKSDDKQFVLMVKELMKIETALLSAKIRKEGDIGGGNNQNFFVVLKGLDDDKKVVQVMDKTIDMKQIENALNPNAEEYVPEEVNSRDAPEQLMKPVERMEGE
jgi:hypothetical protein